MKYDFDEIIDFRNTNSIKYDFLEKPGMAEGVLPMWIADMDFKAPPCVAAAMAERCRHGVFGYSDAGRDYIETLQGWFSRRLSWEIDPEWLVTTPGVVNAICAAIRALTNEGDAVIIQQPVYPSFASSVLNNGRRLVVNQLNYSGGRYTIDYDDFEEKIIQNKVRMFILCSPHNPVGRVWSESELMRLGDICLRHGVTVVSDEIHADFMYPGSRHKVFAGLSTELSDITVTCTAPSKTFNLAGLQISNIFIENSDMRQKLKKELSKSGFGEPGIMGIVACNAAYESGDDWLAQLLDYLTGNLDYARNTLRNIPGIELVEPEGSYLLWLDCSGLGQNDDERNGLIRNSARLWLNEGAMFGAGGAGFQRMNIAFPRSVLKEAFSRLERAVDEKETFN